MATDTQVTASGNTNQPSLLGKAMSSVSGIRARIANLGPTSMVVFSIVCVMVLIIIIAFIVWRIQRRHLKSVGLVKHPLRLYGPGLPLIIDQSKLPPTVNGQEYSYSFWIYLVQYDPANTSIMVFGRGITSENIGGSPLVYLDNNTNKMYISVAKNTGTLSETIDTVNTSSHYATATIDYVPLQRWVNVTLVVQDYLMTIFMDGDLYTVQNVTDKPDIGSRSSRSSGSADRSIFGPTSGDITVGGSAPQAKAFISQLQFYNFALTQRDIKTRYADGPTGGTAMSVFGIPAYGLRSPMYKLDAINDDGSSNPNVRTDD